MALSACKICDAKISTNAKNCLKCGEPDPFRKDRNVRILTKLFSLCIALIAFGYLWFVAMPDLKQKSLIHNATQR